MFLPLSLVCSLIQCVFKHWEVEKPKKKKRAVPKELEYVVAEY